VGRVPALKIYLGGYKMELVIKNARTGDEKTVVVRKLDAMESVQLLRIARLSKIDVKKIIGSVFKQGKKQKNRLSDYDILQLRVKSLVKKDQMELNKLLNIAVADRTILNKDNIVKLLQEGQNKMTNENKNNLELEAEARIEDKITFTTLMWEELITKLDSIAEEVFILLSSVISIDVEEFKKLEWDSIYKIGLEVLGKQGFTKTFMK